MIAINEPQGHATTGPRDRVTGKVYEAPDQPGRWGYRFPCYDSGAIFHNPEDARRIARAWARENIECDWIIE